MKRGGRLTRSVRPVDRQGVCVVRGGGWNPGTATDNGGGVLKPVYSGRATRDGSVEVLSLGSYSFGI